MLPNTLVYSLMCKEDIMIEYKPGSTWQLYYVTESLQTSIGTKLFHNHLLPYLLFTNVLHVNILQMCVYIIITITGSMLILPGSFCFYKPESVPQILSM